MEKICAIISGGEYAAATGINECDYIIACDHGYEHAQRMEVGVDLLLGDFDSYAGTLPQDVEILRLPVEKDDTDTMSAVRHALSRGYRHIRIYRALGGRLANPVGDSGADKRCVCGDIPGKGRGEAPDAGDTFCVCAGCAVQGAKHDTGRWNYKKRRQNKVCDGNRPYRHMGVWRIPRADLSVRTQIVDTVCILYPLTGGVCALCNIMRDVSAQGMDAKHCIKKEAQHGRIPTYKKRVRPCVGRTLNHIDSWQLSIGQVA